MRKLIYISLLAIAGCSPPLSTTSPTQGISAGDLSGYFWHDATYRYQDSLVSHSLSVQAGVTKIVDNNQSTNKSTTFTVSNANGAYSMSGFSNSDLFALDPSLQIVKDTASPRNVTETIRSIASVTPFGQQARLYAASDSVLYEVAFGGNPTLNRLVSFPKGFTLAEDADDQYLFAYQPNGDTIMWTSDDDCQNWLYVKAPSGIKAFSSVGFNYYGDICCFSWGPDIYLVTGGNAPKRIATMTHNVVFMTAEAGGGVVVGLDNNDIWDISRTGSTNFRLNLPKLQGLAFVQSGFTSATILAGTSNGVFSILATGGSPIPVDNGNASIIYSTGSSFFAGTSDSVFHYNPNGTRYGGYANPIGGLVTQFARPTGLPDPTQGVYALSGTTIFRLDSAGSRWTAANQDISQQWHPQPGALVMLTDSMNWFAGYVENIGGGKQHGYAYQASGSGPYAQVTLDNVSYNNVFMVRYTAYSNGVADTTDVPEYLIYFQQGIGPVQIEKTENSNKTITRLVP